MKIKRTLEPQILQAIEKNKVLLLYGPRRVGKTYLLKHAFNNHNDEKIKYVTGEDRLARGELSSQTVSKLQRFIGGAELLIVDNIPNVSVIASSSASFDLFKQLGEPLTGRKKH